MTNYDDPPSFDIILTQLKNAETHTEVMNIIINTFPNWIQSYPLHYSSDYSFFTDKWHTDCKKYKSDPLCILLVNKLIFNDPKFKLLHIFVDLLTLFGHSIKYIHDFIECKFCNCLIPSESIYNELKTKNINVPNKWSMKCLKC